jgi:hypothetical protein
MRVVVGVAGPSKVREELEDCGLGDARHAACGVDAHALYEGGDDANPVRCVQAVHTLQSMLDNEVQMSTKIEGIPQILRDCLMPSATIEAHGTCKSPIFNG